MVGYLVEVLGDSLGRVGPTPYFHHFGMVHEFAAQLFDFPRKSGGEKKGEPLAGEQSDNLANRMDESHIEHAVRLVENKEFEGAEAGFPATDHIQQSTRGGDDEVCALLQRPNLGPFADAPEDGGHPQGEMSGVGQDVFLYLDHQLAGRDHD